MAEILIKIGDNTEPKGYKDGDIICAFNENRIGKCHSDIICSLKNTGFNEDNLRLNGLARKYQELIYQYKFERISVNEVRRTDLITNETDLITNTPNPKGEQMNVVEFIERRLKHPQHKIFGTKGLEVWYGGNTKYNHTDVWDMIETNSSNLRGNFTKWVLTEQEKKSYLALGVDDFTNEEASVLVESEEIQNGIDKDGGPIMEIVKKRKNKVDWQSLSLPETKERIQNKDIVIDIRDSQFLRNNIVIRK